MRENNKRFVIRGTLLEMVRYAKDNNLKFNQIPVHLLGGYFAPNVNNKMQTRRVFVA
jgi:hypothetical protein